jgi:hypothetical protein
MEIVRDKAELISTPQTGNSGRDKVVFSHWEVKLGNILIVKITLSDTNRNTSSIL